MQTLTDPNDIKLRRAKVNRLAGKQIQNDTDLIAVLNSFPAEIRVEIYNEIKPKLQWDVPATLEQLLITLNQKQEKIG